MIVYTVVILDLYLLFDFLQAAKSFANANKVLLSRGENVDSYAVNQFYFNYLGRAIGINLGLAAVLFTTNVWWEGVLVAIVSLIAANVISYFLCYMYTKKYITAKTLENLAKIRQGEK